MNTYLKFGAIALVVIAVLFIAYQAFVAVPNAKNQAIKDAAQMQIDEARRVELAKKIEYESCMSSAWNVYSADWDRKCTLEGKEADCSLAKYQYEDIESRYQTAQERCVTLHK